MQAVLRLCPDRLPVLPACYDYGTLSTIQVQDVLSATLVGITVAATQVVPHDFRASLLWPWFFHVGQIQTQYPGAL